MMNRIRKYLIPHEDNDFKPHLLRNEIAFAIMALILIIEGAFLSQAVLFGRGTGFLALILPNTLVDETNYSRVALNLPPLKEDPLLTAAAQQKANDMAAKSYFAHTSPDGVTPWHWFDQVGYRYAYAGENLAVNFSDSHDVTEAWLKSPDHRANIVNSHYTQIGIATAQGTYEGRQTIFVVQLFGKPAAPKPAPVVVPTPNPTSTPVRPRPAPQPIVVTLAPPPTPAPAVPPQQNFVAVEGVATDTARTSTTPAGVGIGSDPNKPSTTLATASATTPAVTDSVGTTVGIAQIAKQSNLIQRIFSAPRLTANIIYAVLGILMILALALNVFVKANVQHPQLVLNGLMILLTLGTLAVFNQNLLLANAQIF